MGQKNLGQIKCLSNFAGPHSALMGRGQVEGHGQCRGKVEGLRQWQSMGRVEWYGQGQCWGKVEGHGQGQSCYNCSRSH